MSELEGPSASHGLDVSSPYKGLSPLILSQVPWKQSLRFLRKRFIEGVLLGAGERGKQDRAGEEG